MKKNLDLTDLEAYRETIKQQPETPMQRIELDIIERALANLRNGA